MEIWNDVFMQYNKKEDGTFEKLEKPNVDTGMGLERTLAVLNGKKSVFEIELFTPIFQTLHLHSGASATPRRGRIVVDHVRASVMMIADGVLPSNKDQGIYPATTPASRNPYLPPGRRRSAVFCGRR